MITREQMMTPLLEVYPSFCPHWQSFLKEWESEDELPLYIALFDLARELVKLLAAGDKEALVQIFAVVERWHVEGDDYVREAATIGLLEDLQNEGLHETTSPAGFEEFLRPLSQKWWIKLEHFWRDGVVLLDH